jgi:predicted alpha/beta hydrolase family esterase
MSNAPLVRSEKSTTVRSGMPPRPLVAALALTARLSPALAGAWAARIFLTPRRYPRPERERALLARAVRRPRDAQGVASWQWGEGPAVLLVHGWEGRGAQLGGFVDPLVAAGYRVVAFDAPAHGSSAGRSATLADYAEAIRSIGDAIGPLHGLIAHSFGAPSAMLALSRGLRARAAVFVAPPAHMESAARGFAAAFALPPPVQAAMRAAIETRVGLRFEEIDPIRLAPRRITPLLVLHDREDPEVAFAAGSALAHAWPGAALHPTDGLGHRRILRDPAAARAAARFIASFAPDRRCDLDRAIALPADWPPA